MQGNLARRCAALAAMKALTSTAVDLAAISKEIPQ